LLLLEAIQTFEGRTLSYRALDVEQIGHVYEGLLERTVRRVDDVTLELQGSAKAKNTRVTLGEIESARLDGAERVVELLKERSERSESAIRNAIGRAPDEHLMALLLTACRGDAVLRDRISPYVELLRTDSWGYPLVHHDGAFVVMLGADRRESGTHYTPKSLTEKIVGETLTPIAYRGPAEGDAREDWTLKSADELLDLKICDPAMGSGAFLVQTCRWLADRLVEAWSTEEAAGSRIDEEGRLHAADDTATFEPLSRDTEERAILARRLIAERCLYGVDKNPLAVELAKLSLWLTTLAKGRPFGFLDHNLRSGDSLLGIHDIRQLIELDMNPTGKPQLRLFGRAIQAAVNKALELRNQIRSIPIRDIRDIEVMAALDAQSRAELALPEIMANALVGIVLAEGRAGERSSRIATLAAITDEAARGDADARDRILWDARSDLMNGSPGGALRQPFHWPLEFPEVFARDSSGFDALVGNPPFLGNRLWRGTLGEKFQRQCQIVLGVPPGKIDLSVVFHRRAVDLLRPNGSYGMLARSNIAEGSAIEVGLGVIVQNGSIYFARKGMSWPGSAAVVVAIVGFFKGEWRSGCNADERSCPHIGTRLEPEAVDVWTPQALPDAPFAFEGVNNSKGLAFVVTPEDRWFDRLKNEPNSLLRPYITGNDITSSALNHIRRWALDIGDLGLDEIARRWPVAHRFLVEEVQPTRTMSALKSYKGLIDRWWQFWNHRSEMMSRLQIQGRCIAFAKPAKYPFCILAPTDWIYTNKVLLIGFERPDLYAICLSSSFRQWVSKYSVPSLGADRNTLTISIQEAVSTFSPPKNNVSSAGIDAASLFNDLVVSFSVAHACGLTDVLNAIHTPDETDSTIAEMRRLLAIIDTELAAAYEWRDVDVSYDFHAFDGGSASDQWRWSLSPNATATLLDKLVALNRKHFETASIAQHGGRASPCARRSVSTELTQPSLDFDGGAVAAVNGGTAEAVLEFLGAHDGWQAKADIVASTGITDDQWNTVIADLIASGKVERQGGRRGTRYRVAS